MLESAWLVSGAGCMLAIWPCMDGSLKPAVMSFGYWSCGRGTRSAGLRPKSWAGWLCAGPTKGAGAWEW